jgi:hypothetical protein
MAAITAAVAVGVGTAYAANRQGAAQKKAANAQGNAAQQAMQKYTDVYNQGIAYGQPFYDAGTGALSQLQALNSGDMSGFTNSGAYQFARDQGLQGIDRTAAAQGRLRSGGNDVDRMSYASGLASQEYDKQYGRLAQLASAGQQQGQYFGNLGQNYASQYGQALGIKGQADAQRAAAGPMTQAGYGNALASAFSTYAGAGGGFGGGGGGFGGGGGGFGGYTSMLGNQAGSGQGSIYNFGNNVDNFRNWGG